VIHFLVLSALAAAIFLFASNKAALNADFTKILNDLQGGLGGPVNNSPHGIVHDLQKLFAVSITNLHLAGAAVAAYAVLEGTEAVGLWQGRRWAEYLTFVATVIFVPYEVYELTKTISALKVLALVINLAIVAYLITPGTDLRWHRRWSPGSGPGTRTPRSTRTPRRGTRSASPARPYPRGYKNIGVDAREPFEVRDARPAQEIRGQLLLAEPEATVSGRLGQT
jgi:uncharacterized membrane protein (DUF2068 family)